MRVNNDPVHDGAEQFYQWLAVDPVDGTVNVVFYDRRGDPRNRKQIAVLARSTDGGRTFSNYAWSDEPFEAGGLFFGDYSGLAAYGGRVYGIWTEKPVHPTVPERTPPDKKPNPEGQKDEKKQPQGTVIKVGTADFRTASR